MYIFNFIKNFLAIVSPTLIDTLATYTSTIGTDKMLESDMDSIIGTSLTSVATSVTNANDQTYFETQNLELTQAYIESMNEDELNELVYNLENTNIEYDNNNKLIKKL